MTHQTDALTITVFHGNDYGMGRSVMPCPYSELRAVDGLDLLTEDVLTPPEGCKIVVRAYENDAPDIILVTPDGRNLDIDIDCKFNSPVIEVLVWDYLDVTHEYKIKSERI